LVPLFEWPEQKRYEEIRLLELFDVSVAERAEEVGLLRGGWLKVLRLEDYAPTSSRQPEMVQQVLFTYTDAI
jgi:hypothetical protein